MKAQKKEEYFDIDKFYKKYYKTESTVKTYSNRAKFAEVYMPKLRKFENVVRTLKNIDI